MKNKKNNRVKTIVGFIVFYAVLIAIWQGAYMLSDESYKYPNIVDMFTRGVELIQKGSLQIAILSSLYRGFVGYFLAAIVGCLLGLLLIKLPTISSFLKPMMVGLQTLPSVCWVPFAILWFGLGDDSIIFVIIMGSAVSIALTVESSFRNIEPLYLSAASVMGAKGMKLVTKVMIPAAMPSLISGFRQAWSFAWRALMAGEVISMTNGLGQILTWGRELLDINQVMLVMVVIIVIGMVIDKLGFSLLENHVLRKRGIIK